MTTIDRKHFRSFEVLVQSKLAELTGSHPGIVVVVPSERRIDLYSTVGSGVDVNDRDVLRALHWILVERDARGSGWTSVEMSSEERERFLQ